MGTWITPVDSEVLPKTAQERTAIAAIKGVDDLADILAEVVADFRDAIAGRENALDADGMLPQGLAKYARDLALWIFITRGVPKNEGVQTSQRADAAKRAEDMLQGIRDGKVSVEPPTGWTTTTGQNWNSENRLIMRTHPVPPPIQQQPPPSTGGRPYANPDPDAEGDV
jgi:hypothetical protein